ncbi:unnamed protein product [Ceutorhynchus assimilis]|uniref:Platelet-derived growth factor (PDGF) family profile domain-containing protein n=1 Tax=Ceutorhynchus assimilis TaxID=467358 RepID=A0A9N9QD71_9CUCU|nr:unnamed protein product [Ceutorhynchus assimilis]
MWLISAQIGIPYLNKNKQKAANLADAAPQKLVKFRTRLDEKKKMSTVFIGILVLFVTTIRCDDHTKRCVNRCLQTKNNNLDIYLEYKKAVLQVPMMMTSPPSLPGNTLERHLRHLVSAAVSLRDFQVEPVEESCSSFNFNKTRNNIKCKPRPFILDVVSSQGKVFPDKILTKQCAGFCTGNKRCAPTKTVNVSTSVQILLADRRVRCSTILVPRDVKCKCQCATSRMDCNRNQAFDRNSCVCACTNKNEEKHCYTKIEKFRLHMWDPKTCSCVCRTEQPCSTGKIWDKILCRCSKKT